MSVKELWVMGVVVVLLGCPSGTSNDAGSDGGAPDSGATPPCNCEVNGDSMTMSWDCYCAANDCNVAPSLTCSPGNPDYRESSIACGVRVDTFGVPGGVSARIFDETDALVGVDLEFDIPLAVCPDVASLRSRFLRAGVQPDAGCAQTVCDCVDGGVVCP